MQRKSQRGFTMAEVLMVTSLISFATTGVMTLVSKKHKNGNGEQYYRQMVMDGHGTVNHIASELRLAGLPRKAENAALTFANSNKVAATTFLVANSDQIVFEADLDHNGTVERVEYRLRGETLERSAVTKNADGSVPQSRYEPVAERVDNGGMPVFTFDGDVNGDKPVAADPQQVRVMLLLRSPVRDRKSGRARIVGFEALAQRNLTSPASQAGELDASTPESTPADVAATVPASAPATEPAAEVRPTAATEIGAQNSPDSRQTPTDQRLELPVISPADAAQSEPAEDAEHAEAPAPAEPLRAGVVIASTDSPAAGPAADSGNL